MANVDTITLHWEDLSSETLGAIRNDLSPYAHLALYRDLYERLGRLIKHQKAAGK